MLKRIGQYSGLISGVLGTASTILPLNTAFLDIIQASVDFNAGDYFYMTLQEDDLVEEVKVTGATSTYAVIERAQGITDAQTFSLAATYNTALTSAAVEELAATLTPIAPIDIQTTGIAEATLNPDGSWTINVPQPVINGVSGVETTTAFPNYEVALVNNGGCCEGDATAAAGAATINIVGSGIADASIVNGDWQINVPAPAFTGNGVAITGAWPNLTFTAAAGSGGTVTSVAVSNGLSLTGSPNVNPTISISNTLAAGKTTTGISFNTRGQATAISATFDPISILTGGDGVSVVRTGEEATISLRAASEGIVGVVALADAAAPLDTNDVSTAVTPALLGNVIADLQNPTAANSQSFSGEADADYTYTVPTTPFTLTLLAGESALVFANLTVRDNATPTTGIDYGMAVFAGAAATRIQSNKKLTQNNQSMSFVITGPFDDGLILKTTALVAGAAVISHSLTALKL